MYPKNVLPTPTDSRRNQNFFLLLITDILLPLSCLLRIFSVPAYIFFSFSIIIITLFLSSLLIFHCFNAHAMVVIFDPKESMYVSYIPWPVLDNMDT